jgi:hypothetical protein
VLDGIGTVGVVDVPGHEGFVRTMVAGATGIDLALVVVAADEGVMPQTREHLAILACSASTAASSPSPSRPGGRGVARARHRRRARRARRHPSRLRR